MYYFVHHQRNLLLIYDIKIFTSYTQYMYICEYCNKSMGDNMKEFMKEYEMGELESNYSLSTELRPSAPEEYGN
jgi:hypothetical protein